MPSPESPVRRIDATYDNAHRIAVLTYNAYANKDLYTPEQLAGIIDPTDHAQIERIFKRLQHPRRQPQYHGYFVDDQLEGDLKTGTWGIDDQATFTPGVVNPREYHSLANKNIVFGAHTLAVDPKSMSLAGISLFRHATKELAARYSHVNSWPGITIKAAVDVRDKPLIDYVQRAWRMTDTGLIAPVPVGNLPESEWPDHQMFEIQIDRDGKGIHK